MQIKTTLIIPDTHVPHHDRKALELTYRITEHLKKQLSKIILIGDFGEVEAASRWEKPADKFISVETDIKLINMALDEIDHRFKCEKIYIEGNHEDRLRKYLNNQAPVLFGLVNIKDLLKINTRKKWKWVPYGNRQSYYCVGNGSNKLFCRHEPYSTNLKNSIMFAGHSYIFGHIHNFDEASLVTTDGRPFVATSCGFLGVHSDPIFDYAKTKFWSMLGFTLIHYDRSGNWHLEKVRINKVGKNYIAYAMGKVFKI